MSEEEESSPSASPQRRLSPSSPTTVNPGDSTLTSSVASALTSREDTTRSAPLSVPVASSSSTVDEMETTDDSQETTAENLNDESVPRQQRSGDDNAAEFRIAAPRSADGTDQELSDNADAQSCPGNASLTDRELAVEAYRSTLRAIRASGDQLTVRQDAILRQMREVLLISSHLHAKLVREVASDPHLVQLAQKNQSAHVPSSFSQAPSLVSFIPASAFVQANKNESKKKKKKKSPIAGDAVSGAETTKSNGQPSNPLLATEQSAADAQAEQESTQAYLRLGSFPFPPTGVEPAMLSKLSEYLEIARPLEKKRRGRKHKKDDTGTEPSSKFTSTSKDSSKSLSSSSASSASSSSLSSAVTVATGEKRKRTSEPTGSANLSGSRTTATATSNKKTAGSSGKTRVVSGSGGAASASSGKKARKTTGAAAEVAQQNTKQAGAVLPYTAGKTINPSGRVAAVAVALAQKEYEEEEDEEEDDEEEDEEEEEEDESQLDSQDDEEEDDEEEEEDEDDSQMDYSQDEDESQMDSQDDDESQVDSQEEEDEEEDESQEEESQEEEDDESQVDEEDDEEESQDDEEEDDDDDEDDN